MHSIIVSIRTNNSWSVTMPTTDFHRFFPCYLDTHTQLLLSKAKIRQQQLSDILASMRADISEQLDNIFEITSDDKKHLQWLKNRADVEKAYKLLTKVRHFLKTRQHSDDSDIVRMREVLQQFDILITTHYTTLGQYISKEKPNSRIRRDNKYKKSSVNLFDNYYQKCFSQPTPSSKHDLDPLCDEILDRLDAIEHLTEHNAEMFILLMNKQADAREKLAFTNRAISAISAWHNNPNKYVKLLHTTICTYEDRLKKFIELYHKHDPKINNRYKSGFEQALEKRMRTKAKSLTKIAL